MSDVAHWHHYKLARTGRNHVMAAAEHFADCRPLRNQDGSLRIVTAYGADVGEAERELDRAVAAYK